MAFKDAVAADIDRVFLNEQEFGERHTVDKVEIVCVVNDDKQAKMKNGFLLGNIEADVVLFGRTDQLPPKKGIGATVVFDFKQCKVVAWQEAMGVTEIALNQTVALGGGTR